MNTPNYLIALSILLSAIHGAQAEGKDGEQSLDLSSSVKELYSIKWALEHADNLAPFLERRVAEKGMKRLTKTVEAIETLGVEVKAAVDEMKREFRIQFLPAESAKDLQVRIAPRSKAFLDRLPQEVKVESHDGTIRITKTGDRDPISYHACLSRPLNEGPCMIISFRLTKSGSGGTPVPYFGVRDRRGKEEVLCNFATDQEAQAVHVIYLFRDGSEFAVLFDDRIVTKRTRGLEKELFPFFHMNDESEVVLESVLIPVAKKPNSGNKAREDKPR